MNFTTIFFMDTFLENLKDRNFFTKNFTQLLDTLKKEKIRYFFLSRKESIIENFLFIDMIFISNSDEEKFF